MKIPIEKGIIRIGDIEVREETMPAGACCKATSDRVTPMKGPKIAPRAMLPIAVLSFQASLISGHFFLRVIRTVKEIKAALILIWVAARGL